MKSKPILDLKQVQKSMGAEEFAEYCIVNMDNDYFLRHFNSQFNSDEKLQIMGEIAKKYLVIPDKRMESIAADVKSKKITKTEYELLDLLYKYEGEAHQLEYSDLLTLLAINMEMIYSHDYSIKEIEKKLLTLQDKGYVSFSTVRANKNKIDRNVKTRF